MIKVSSGYLNTASLISPIEVAAILGVTQDTLAVWRCTNRYDLAYVKVGRLVKYRPEDIEAFIKSRTCNYREVRS